MFKAFKESWIALFGTITNVFKSTEYGSGVIRLVAEEAYLSQELESSALIRDLQKSLAVE